MNENLHERVSKLAKERKITFSAALDELMRTDPAFSREISNAYQAGPRPRGPAAAETHDLSRLSTASAVDLGASMRSSLDAYKAIIARAMELWRSRKADSPGHGLELAVAERPDLAKRVEEDPPPDDVRLEVMNAALGRKVA